MKKRLALATVVVMASGLVTAMTVTHRAQVVPVLAADSPGSGTQVCGQPMLDSPYSYAGAAGSYTSGTEGLPTYGAPGTDFPNDTAGVVLPPQTQDYLSYQLSPNTVYYLEPGDHYSSFQADTGDSFVGGYANGTGTVVDGQGTEQWAFDLNMSIGNQTGVTIEYLTVQNFHPDGEAGAIDQSGGTGWTIKYDTITHNVPGAGAIAAADSTLEYDCLSFNGQYGFQSSARDGYGMDSLTQGPYNVTIKNNEIAYNDTCDWEGTLDNSAIGWSNYNPVPARYRPDNCGPVSPDGNTGGFKLWRTDGVTVADNYIHNNYGPGGWVDTDNANTTVTGNYISDNDGEAWIEEVSYNFEINSNTMVDNDWADGLGNSSFPQVAVYISESGSDTTFGGVPGCPEASCSGQPTYQYQSYVTGNIMTDNGGSVFLWENSNRFCNDGSEDGCPLVAGGESHGAFTAAACQANLSTASFNTVTWKGNITGSPAADYWDGCRWKTENVSVSGNTINFTPSHIPDCNATAWPDCGATGTFSLYGVSAPYDQPGGWLIPSALTFHQGNTWSDNTYNGPTPFFVWNQGSGDNPLGWSAWSGPLSGGDQCMSSGEEQSGYCVGPFGQESGSTYNGSESAGGGTGGGNSQAPQVMTGGATGVTSSSATLNAGVNPEGEATTYQFDYGTTTSYGSSAPVTAAPVGTGTTAVFESFALAGLQPSTTYHYRIEATNAEGTTYGLDAAFTTGSAPGGGGNGGSGGNGGGNGGNGGGNGGNAVTYDATGPGAFGASCGDCSSLSWTHTVSGSNTALLVGVSVGGNSSQTVSVTDNGTPMIAETGPLNTDNQSAGFLQVFGLAGAPSGVNTIAVAISGMRPVEITGGSESFGNVDQLDPFGPTVSSYGSGTTATVTTDGSTPGDMIAGFLSNGSPIGAVASPAVSRFIANYSSNTGAGTSAGATLAATGGHVTLSWDLENDWWAAVALQVNYLSGSPSTAGPSPSPSLSPGSPSSVPSSVSPSPSVGSSSPSSVPSSVSPSPSVGSSSPSPVPSTSSAPPSPSASSSASSPSATPTNWAWCSSDPFGAWNTPDQFILYNNEWNTDYNPGPQTICGNSAGDWQVTSDQPAGNTAVLTYPSVQKNYPDVPLSSFSSMTSSYAENMNAVSGTDAEAAYDIWINGLSQEVMFWVDNHGQTPAGSLQGTVTLGGLNWNLYVTGQGYYAFVLDHNAPSGTVDLLAGLKYLESQGYLQGSDQLWQVNFGWEICSTAGSPETFTVSNYSLTSSGA